LMSVKNCSRDVLVSRNSSQMALDESVCTNACKIFFVLTYRNIFVIAINSYFGYVCIVKYLNLSVNEYICIITVGKNVNISFLVNGLDIV
jgi:hypothetical protein